MNRKSRAVVALLAGFLLAGTSAGVATASPDDRWGEGLTAIVSGVEYGPEDGLVEEEVQIDLIPGQGTIDLTWGSSAPGGITPMVEWGSSYARSTEYYQAYFLGRAKAGGNVYSGKRIIKVCVWYSMDSWATSKACSSAYEVGMGLWASGAEKSVGTLDSPNPWATKMKFNYTRTLINP